MPYEVWLSEEAVEDRDRLTEEQDRKLIWWRSRLARDVTVGDPIRKLLIPVVLKRDYEINNLWRLELPEGRRVLYTIASRPTGRPEVLVLRSRRAATGASCVARRARRVLPPEPLDPISLTRSPAPQSALATRPDTAFVPGLCLPKRLLALRTLKQAKLGRDPGWVGCSRMRQSFLSHGRCRSLPTFSSLAVWTIFFMK